MLNITQKCISILLISSVLFISLTSCSKKDTTKAETNPGQNNITFISAEWTMYSYEESFIEEQLHLMQEADIKYQVIDLGYFDKDYESGNMEQPIAGEMNGKSTEYLERWLACSRETAPEIKNLAVLNGSTELHIAGKNHTISGEKYQPAESKTEMHKSIIAYAKYLLSNYQLDGLVLDFEPVLTKYAEDYASLLHRLRKEIGTGTPLFLCGAYSENLLDDKSILAFSEYADAYISMDYDSSCTNAAQYKKKVAKGVARIGKLLQDTDMEYYPIGPGNYADTSHHRSSVENAKSHSEAVLSAMQEKDVQIAGSGLWWWQGSVEDGTELQNFIQYWVEQEQ